MSMQVIFGEEKIYKFLNELIALIKKLNNTLSTEIADLDDYSMVKELLRGWRARSSEEIQELYSKLKAINETAKKPSYEVFIDSVSKEYEKNEDFKDCLNEIGEALVDLKETIKRKI
jgi:transcription elongation factor GreA-like protein